MQEHVGSAGLDLTMRRKRARIRAWHRGIKEMDLILGGFFDRNGESFSETEMGTFEQLMTRNDQDLYRYVTQPSMITNSDLSAAEQALIERIADNLANSNESERT